MHMTPILIVGDANMLAWHRGSDKRKVSLGGTSVCFGL